MTLEALTAAAATMARNLEAAILDETCFDVEVLVFTTAAGLTFSIIGDVEACDEVADIAKAAGGVFTRRDDGDDGDDGEVVDFYAVKVAA